MPNLAIPNSTPTEIGASLTDSLGKMFNSVKDKIDVSQRHIFSNLDPTLSYVRTSKPSEQYNIQKIMGAIAGQETGNMPADKQYGFNKKAGNTMGLDLGKYQVTSGELQSYGKQFLGNTTTPQQFLASPGMQDQYMNRKIQFLLNEGVPLKGVYALHSQGMTHWGNQSVIQNKIQQSNLTRKGYVDRAFESYGGDKVVAGN